jgi:hypothetical protein
MGYSVRPASDPGRDKERRCAPRSRGQRKTCSAELATAGVAATGHADTLTVRVDAIMLRSQYPDPEFVKSMVQERCAIAALYLICNAANVPPREQRIPVYAEPEVALTNFSGIATF